MENYDFLTEKQKVAYTLRQKGLSFQEIAKSMGNTYTSARRVYAAAEKRIEECEKYNRKNEHRNQPVDLVLTQGEIETIVDALVHYEIHLRPVEQINVKSDWLGKEVYRSLTVKQLLGKLRDI